RRFQFRPLVRLLAGRQRRLEIGGHRRGLSPRSLFVVVHLFPPSRPRFFRAVRHRQREPRGRAGLFSRLGRRAVLRHARRVLRVHVRADEARTFHARAERAVGLRVRALDRPAHRRPRATRRVLQRALTQSRQLREIMLCSLFSRHWIWFLSKWTLFQSRACSARWSSNRSRWMSEASCSIAMSGPPR